MLSECVQLGNPPESDGIRRIWLQPKTIRRKSAENPPKIRRNSVGIRRKFMWIDCLPPESAGIRRIPTESDGFCHFPHAPRWGIRRNPSESVENPTESGGFTSGRTSNPPKFAESAEIRRNPCTSQPNPPESVGIRRNPTDSGFFCDFVYRKAIEIRWISADSVEIRRKSAGCKNGSAGFRRIPSKSDGFWWIFLGRRARKVTQMMGFAEIRRNPTESGGFGRR